MNHGKLRSTCPDLGKFGHQRTDFPYACPPPSNYPAHAFRCPSQSGDLKVNCASNRTVRIWGNFGIAQISPMRALPLQTILLTDSDALHSQET